jgi:hypothetical protein
MKKAQSISINAIIIAALALIVLVVLIAVFSGRMSIFGIGLDQAQRGQKCPGTMVGPGVECSSLGSQSPANFNIISCVDKETPSNGCYVPGWTCCVPTK